MHWILQENLFKEKEWDTLLSVLDRFNIPYSVHKVIPFIGELIPAPEPKQKNVICFGSYSMRHSAREFGWTPGVFDLEPYNFNVQMQHWSDLLLNADAEVVAFKDAVIMDDTFIRPIDDSKHFAGRVYGVDEFVKWQHSVCTLEEDYGSSLSPNTLIQLCRPKKIYAEYRFWIVDGQIVTQSLYKRGDRVTYSSDVDSRFHSFVNMVLRYRKDIRGVTMSCTPDGWIPERAFVLDVCETPEGMKIVEINTINAAGFYAGNMTDLVLSLEAMQF
jgi:hypothetical protein